MSAPTPRISRQPTIAARGLVVKQDITEPSNWRVAPARSTPGCAAQGMTGIAGVDTRALTIRIRDGGAPNGVLASPPTAASTSPPCGPGRRPGRGWRAWTSPRRSPARQSYDWDETQWAWPAGFGRQTAPTHHVVAVDYGAKRNILRCLASAGCRVTVVPATATAEDILRHQPDGVFLSNGPGDPAATGDYAVPAIQGVLAAGMPVFGICLGHQLLALALGAKTYKLDARPSRRQPAGEGPGHRQGGDHQPEPRLRGGRRDACPRACVATHVSLFDGSNEGLACTDRPAFSVQYHPEASPGPTDSHYLFQRFVGDDRAADLDAALDAVSLLLRAGFQHRRSPKRMPKPASRASRHSPGRPVSTRRCTTRSPPACTTA